MDFHRRKPELKCTLAFLLSPSGICIYEKQWSRNPRFTNDTMRSFESSLWRTDLFVDYTFKLHYETTFLHLNLTFKTMIKHVQEISWVFTDESATKADRFRWKQQRSNIFYRSKWINILLECSVGCNHKFERYILSIETTLAVIQNDSQFYPREKKEV